MREEIVTSVPDSEVEKVVLDFKSEGALVVKERQPNGTWRVTATFPDGKATETFGAGSDTFLTASLGPRPD